MEVPSSSPATLGIETNQNGNRPAAASRAPAQQQLQATSETEVDSVDVKADTALALAPTDGRLATGLAGGPAGQAATLFKNVADANATSLSPSPTSGIAPTGPHPTSVLDTFSFVRNGDAIRIEDSDGSVYAGRVLEAQVSAGKAAATLERALPAKPPARVAFEARGTNRTLNELVVIDAYLGFLLRTNQFSYGTATVAVPAVAQTTAAPVNLGVRMNFTGESKMQVPPAQSKLYQIEGTARVGSNPPILLRAVHQ